MYDFQTEHLGCDSLDAIWFKRPDLATDAVLGFIDGDPYWPTRLGPEPEWYERELASLLDTWKDAVRFQEGCTDQVERDYRDGKGV